MNEAILGIDVSKKDLSIALLLHTSYKKYKVSNNIKGFIDLTKWLQAQGIEQVNACMEAPGSYGEKLAEYASKNELRAYKPKDPALKELRSLYRCLQNLKDQHTQVSNFLENKDCLPRSVERVY